MCVGGCPDNGGAYMGLSPRLLYIAFYDQVAWYSLTHDQQAAWLSREIFDVAGVARMG